MIAYIICSPLSYFWRYDTLKSLVIVFLKSFFNITVIHQFWITLVV